MKLIRSRSNPFFRELVRLVGSARERRRQGITVLDGVHLIQAYRQTMGAPETLVVGEEALHKPEVATLLAALSPLEPLLLADTLLREASPVETPAGIMALVRQPVTVRGTREDFALMLEDVQDPGNVGAILRSAAAAGAGRAWLSGGCADPWSPRVLRAGMGAHFYLQVIERADLAAAASVFPGMLVALIPLAQKSLYELDLTGPVAFLIGNEGAGLSAPLAELAHERVGIPMPGALESLNAAAAAAVCLAEKVRQELARTAR